jgi:hypothetical protein
MVTLTTIGLGDFYTVTRSGVLLNIAFSVVGLGIIASSLHMVADYVESKEQAAEKALLAVAQKPQLEAGQIKSWVGKTASANIRLLGLLAYLVLLMYSSGLLFRHLENDHEIERMRTEDSILENLYLGDKATYIAVLGSAYQPQCEITECHTNWSGNKATFFAFTIATAIGYGDHGGLISIAVIVQFHYCCFPVSSSTTNCHRATLSGHLCFSCSANFGNMFCCHHAKVDDVVGGRSVHGC